MARSQHIFCNRRAAILLALATAIPLSLIAFLERAATAAGTTIAFPSRTWFQECAKWDPSRRRFLVSTFFEGQIAEIRVAGNGGGSEAVEVRTVVADGDVAGNASLGIAIDGNRGRFLVVYADVRRYRAAAVAAYDLDTGERLFLTRLSYPEKHGVMVQPNDLSRSIINANRFSSTRDSRSIEFHIKKPWLPRVSAPPPRLLRGSANPLHLRSASAPGLRQHLQSHR